jgi:tRNA-dihydrouridine synthase B
MFIMLIGDIAVSAGLALAPMAGVGDTAFRDTCRRYGASLTFTEMVSAKALVYQDGKTRSLLRLGPGEHPAGAQIFGGDAECMARAAVLALEISGADFIDINMGCPVGKVVRNGDGCALMRDPERAYAIIRAVSSAAGRPVTVKIRKGWDRGDVNAVEFAKMAQDAGASAVTVHGRTRAQLYSGTADWDIIREVKRALSIPVIANGDIFSGSDVTRVLARTGADMAMTGRGAFGNPWIFRDARAALRGGAIPPAPSLRERLEEASRQFEASLGYKGERLACLEARRYYAWYLRGIPHCARYRERISKITSANDLYRIADEILRTA